MRYSSKGLRRRGDTDKWEVTLTHKDPLSGEIVRSYHTVTARTEKQAQKRRDELIRDLEDRGLAAGAKMTVSELADLFIEYKANSGTVERSTLDGYRKQAKALKRDIGDIRVCELSSPDVSSWMASMTERGYAPRSVQRPFSLLKQMMKYAMAMDLVTKNPCEFCKPPKIQRKKVNTLSREERTRMMRLAREAEPAPPRPRDRARAHDRHAPRRDMRAALVGPGRLRGDGQPGARLLGRHALRQGAQDHR